MMTHQSVVPRDVYELRLARIWADVLRRDDIGVTDDFFGGDRDEAKAVLAAVAVQFDAAPSLEAFLAEPTVEQLACHLRARSSGRLNEETVVALQPDGNERPFFFVPSGEGNVFNFHHLARRMAPDQPFYGLQTRGLYGDRPPHDHVEDWAAHHIEAMRAVQPRGPYLLGGHCIGAMVALEMALQLQRRGERVALLAAVDALAPAAFYRDEFSVTIADDTTEFYVFLSKGFKYWFGRDVPLEPEELRALAPERHAAYFMDVARRHAIYTPDAPDDRGDRVLALARRICRNTYVPGEVGSVPITFFRGHDSQLCETATGGWDEVTTQPLRVRELPGNHVTIVTEPHVDALARALRAEIVEARV